MESQDTQQLQEEASGSNKVTATENTPLISQNGAEDVECNSSETMSEPPGKGGLSVVQTTLLIAGGMAGPGVLSLPRVLVRTGWWGVVIIIGMCAAAAFSGKRLGDCWSLLEDRHHTLRSHQRNPYAIIVNAALGSTWSEMVSLCILMTFFGAGVVYLLMAAQIIEDVFLQFVPTVTYCIWFLIVTASITPYIFFGTPKDFHFIGTIAFGSSLLACILYFVQIMSEMKSFSTYRYGIHGFKEFFMAFGTIVFAFGGASTLPTIQNDMVDRRKFYKSIHYSFAAILCLYLPIAIAGYAVYGESAAPNIATSVSPTALSLTANVLMVVHLLSAFVVIINPVCQELEELYSVPKDSLGWRMIVRGAIMLGVLFVGDSVPRFYTILALLGGTTTSLLTFVLPPYCFLQLSQARSTPGQAAAASATSARWPTHNWKTAVCWLIIVLGVFGGAAAAVSALSAIFSSSQTKPCYLR